MMDLRSRFVQELDGVVFDLLNQKIAVKTGEGRVVTLRETKSVDIEAGLDEWDSTYSHLLALDSRYELEESWITDLTIPLPVIAVMTPLNDIKESDLVVLPDGEKCWFIPNPSDCRSSNCLELMRMDGEMITITPATMLGSRQGVLRAATPPQSALLPLAMLAQSTMSDSTRKMMMAGVMLGAPPHLVAMMALMSQTKKIVGATPPDETVSQITGNLLDSNLVEIPEYWVPSSTPAKESVLTTIKGMSSDDFNLGSLGIGSDSLQCTIMGYEGGTSIKIFGASRGSCLTSKVLLPLDAQVILSISDLKAAVLHGSEPTISKPERVETCTLSEDQLTGVQILLSRSELGAAFRKWLHESEGEFIEITFKSSLGEWVEKSNRWSVLNNSCGDRELSDILGAATEVKIPRSCFFPSGIELEAFIRSARFRRKFTDTLTSSDDLIDLRWKKDAWVADGLEVLSYGSADQELRKLSKNADSVTIHRDWIER